MPKTVSASEAKNRFGSILGWIHEHQDEIIVESRGEPKAVIMSYSEYEKNQEFAGTSPPARSAC